MTIVKLALVGVSILTVVRPYIQAADAATAHGGNYCMLYENKNFDGITLRPRMNQSVRALPASIDQKISSVRVHQGCILVGFADADFKGLSETWGSGSYAIMPKGWNDVVSSIQCNCTR